MSGATSPAKYVSPFGDCNDQPVVPLPLPEPRPSTGSVSGLLDGDHGLSETPDTFSLPHSVFRFRLAQIGEEVLK